MEQPTELSGLTHCGGGGVHWVSPFHGLHKTLLGSVLTLGFKVLWYNMYNFLVLVI